MYRVAGEILERRSELVQQDMRGVDDGSKRRG
jgi:hypothetical protein